MNKLLFSSAACYILLAFFCPLPVKGVDLFRSVQSDIFDNPFIAIGVNHKNKMITGYVAALRTAPGRTDECKFFFSGKLESDFLSKILIEDVAKSSQHKDIVKERKLGIAYALELSQNMLIIEEDALPADCSWILSFIDEPRADKKGNKFFLKFDADKLGDWSAINIIRSARARFYHAPDVLTPKRAFLVEGDLVYIYKETKDWYYVRYQGPKHSTLGWLKKSDTIRFK